MKIMDVKIYLVCAIDEAVSGEHPIKALNAFTYESTPKSNFVENINFFIFVNCCFC